MSLKVPLTRSTDDLSHKGRGILTHNQLLTSIMSVSGCSSMDTSPLVGEVVRRTGEGSLIFKSGLLRWLSVLEASSEKVRSHEEVVPQ